jgi:hypothetical protein
MVIYGMQQKAKFIVKYNVNYFSVVKDHSFHIDMKWSINHILTSVIVGFWTSYFFVLHVYFHIGITL